MKNEIEGYLTFKEISKIKCNERNMARGLKEFSINGKSYWAINYKNALKKFNRINPKH